MFDRRSEVTRLLLAWTDGDETARERLMPLVFSELRRTAKHYLDRELPGHTLQPTALVNELYLRLVDQHKVQWKNRAHFFGAAAQMMRRILVDHARIRRAEKRGEGVRPVSLEEITTQPEKQDLELIALDDAMKSLARIDERQSRAVELRYFAGLSNEEIAEVLTVSTRTVKRDLRTARLWLRQEIRGRPLLPWPDSADEGRRS